MRGQGAGSQAAKMRGGACEKNWRLGAGAEPAEKEEKGAGPTGEKIILPVQHVVVNFGTFVYNPF